MRVGWLSAGLLATVVLGGVVAVAEELELTPEQEARLGKYLKERFKMGFTDYEFIVKDVRSAEIEELREVEVEFGEGSGETFTVFMGSDPNYILVGEIWDITKPAPKKDGGSQAGDEPLPGLPEE